MSELYKLLYVSHRYLELFPQLVISLLGPSVGLKKTVSKKRKKVLILYHFHSIVTCYSSHLTLTAIQQM